MNFVATVSQKVSFLPEFGNILILKKIIYNKIFSFQKTCCPLKKIAKKINSLFIKVVMPIIENRL